MNIDEDIKKYQNVRRPAVSGQFYPSDPQALKLKINQFLESTSNDIREIISNAIIVPHAGYDYSGMVAAYAFDLLKNKKINTVVIICNSHSDYFLGIAIDESDAWETPLGQVALDFELAENLVNNNDVIKFNSEVHISDHTLEVQLPFLQTVLQDGFKIVPIVFGNAESGAYAILASALNKYLGSDDLLVVSTDLSHYPTNEVAKEIDEKTLELIKADDINNLERHIKKTMERRLPNEQTLCCGICAVKTLMALAKERGWDERKVLKYMNSGDVLGGDRDRVVGYGAMVFGEKGESIKNEKLKIKNYNTLLNSGQKELLLGIVRKTIEFYIKDNKVPEFDILDERLLEMRGAFVTLKTLGHLRGCIGQILPSAQPLWQVVRDMAIAAAVDDPRFQPVSAHELADLKYEISVLSVPEQIMDWKTIKLGQDGVIVRSEGRSGVFLPQVADEVDWSLEEFLEHLCADKAGLASDAYKSDPNIEILTFQAEVF